MYKQKTWKRVAVLFAGPAMNFVIGLVLIYGIALVWGPAEPAPPTHRRWSSETSLRGTGNHGKGRRVRLHR